MVYMSRLHTLLSVFFHTVYMLIGYHVKKNCAVVPALLAFAILNGQASPILANAGLIGHTHASAPTLQQVSSVSQDDDVLTIRPRSPFKLNAWLLPAYHAISQVTVAQGVVLSTQIIKTAAGPELVTLLDIDLTNPNIHLGVVQAHDQLVSPDEVVSSMANRTGAVAGINGDFFEINASGRPIGMVQMQSQLWQSPAVYAVLGITASGQLTMGAESFDGNTVTDGQASHSLTSVNHYAEAAKGGLVLATPHLGASVPIPGDNVAILTPVAHTSDAFTVQSLQFNASSLPALADQDALVGGGSAGQWLKANIHVGDRLHVTTQVSPDQQLVYAIGGGPIVIKNGASYNDPHPPAPNEANVRYPLTAVGVNKDSTHALFAVFDGHYADPIGSPGLTHSQATQYLLAYGAYQAMLFDTGGSSELVARRPGQSAVSVINWPSDGQERPVANGLFVYSH